MKFTLFLLLTAAAAGAAAQGAHKCTVNGKTVFQDEPCREGRRYSDDPLVARPPREAPDASMPGGPIEAGRLLCREMAPKMVAWKDADSLRVGEVFGGKMAVISVSGVKVGGRQFYVPINGKNSYGGYTGYKSLICNTSEDGTRILGVDSILIDAKP